MRVSPGVTFALLLSAVLAASNALGAGVLPLTKVEYEFVYDRLERTDALSVDHFVYHIGPYSWRDLTASIAPFDDLRYLPRNSILASGFLKEDFRVAGHATGRGYESFRGALAAAPHGKLFVYANLVLDEQRARDPDYRGKKWRGLAGDIEQAFVRYQSGMVAVTAGRFSSFWGPRNSLLLASRIAMDGIGYTFRWGRLALSYRLAWLDGLNPDRDGTDQFENRYFAAHRLDIVFSKHFQVGLFESVIFGGPGRQVDLYYLNPILFFHGVQLNEGINDNTFIGFDFSLKPRAGIKLYGQLLVDDLQIERQTQSDEEPDQLGLLTGLYLADLFGALDIKAEYSRVTNWMFNQSHERNRYLYKNQPIGGTLGNDYDLGRVSVIKWFGGDLATSLNFVYMRQGEGRITDEWTAPWLLITGDYGESFPTGTVQKTTSVVLGAKGFLLGHMFFDLSGGIDWVANFGHVQHDNRTIPFINLTLSTFFSAPIRVD